MNNTLDGRIIKLEKDLYTVFSSNALYSCKARGRFRNENISPMVGDNVEMQKLTNKEGYILEVNQRKNELQRPNISNIDLSFIITSVVEPSFSSLLLDKLIILSEVNNIKPIIIFTKLDIAKKDDLINIKEYIKYYKKIGYKVLTNKNLFLIKRIIKNKVAVFSGQSGAGKSTLLNKLNKTLNLETAAISKALGRGKHTTRHTELMTVSKGFIADTPGFSSIDLSHIKKENLKDYFIEFKNYNCNYKNCLHINERDCKIKDAIKEKEIIESRYNNYKKIMEEIK